jgi:hypothetical protein
MWEVARSWRCWRDQHRSRQRLLGVLTRTAASIALKDYMRGLRSWRSYIESQREASEQLRRFRRTAARLRKPKLVYAMVLWSSEARLMMMEERLGVGGEVRTAELCKALRRCLRRLAWHSGCTP